MPETNTTTSWTLAMLLSYAIDRVEPQTIFDRDPYESRRKSLPGSRLLQTLVFYQMLKTTSQRGLVRVSNSQMMHKQRSVENWRATHSRMRSRNATSIK